MSFHREVLSIEELESRIGYVFENKSIVKRALTHRSFAADHNERLEFLGDSVLNCVIGYALFLRDKHFTEGVLSRARANLVCEKALNEIAREIDIGAFIYLGDGELKTGGAARPSILADACEAVFGAVFLDGGFEKAREVILRLYEPILTSAAMAHERLDKDAKTKLQEYLQGLRYPLPEYKVMSVSGPSHKQVFHCSCTIPKLQIVEHGEGQSRRAGEQEAAEKAFKRALELAAQHY